MDNNTYKLRILLSTAITLLLIGSFFSPIVSSIQIGSNNKIINTTDDKTITNILTPQKEKISNSLDLPSWPTNWILVDTDPTENGAADDYRDVQNVYFDTDPDYIYLRQECYGPAGWSYGDARYKFWFDLDCNANLSGGNLVEGEFLFFVEDINDDNIGEIYLLEDLDNDGMFSEWEDPPDYYSSGLITDPNIAGYQITGNYVDLYLDLDQIVNPYSGCIVWGTDQENPNIDQAPNTDRPDDDDIPFPILNPHINLDKQANTHLVHVGDTITYTYIVTNNGELTLTDVTVVDNILGSVTLNNTVLEPNQWAIGTLTYTVTTGDIPGPIVNTALATGTDPTGDPINNIDSEYVVIEYGPEISLDKQANINTANIGETITYTYNVTNTGDVTLTSITLADDMLGSITLGATSLAPGVFTTGTATYTVSESDIPGPIINNATVTGTPPYGDNVNDTDSESVSITYNACIDIVKAADDTSASIGQVVTYTFTVTNCGDVTLTGVTVVDDMLGSITLGSTTLGPGVSTTGTATYTVTESDLPGPIVNNATATGTPPVGSVVSDYDIESVSVIINPCIDIVKSADIHSVPIGGVVTYTFTVTNCGDVTLTGVTVVDNKLGAITLGTTTLSPGQSTQGTKSITTSCDHYPILTNIAVATGTDPLGGTVTDQDSENVNIIINAMIKIEKEVYNPYTGQWTNSLTIYFGNNIDFKITVKNEGDTVLNNVQVTDYLPSFLTYNYDGNPTPDYENDHQIQWNLGTLNINQQVTLYYSAYAEEEGGSANNIANTSGFSCIAVYDESEIPINVIPCEEEVWIDDNWHGQSDVNLYNPALMWGINAFNHIQQGIDVLCNCGTVHVLGGTYLEQIIINKDLQMLGEDQPLLKLPGMVNSYTIDGSTEYWVPIILAYGGVLNGNDITGTGNIAVKIDGFKFDARNHPNSVAILYHNVESGCVPAQISNNIIIKVPIGIKIDGCTDDTTIIHNRIIWEQRTIGKIGMIITSSGGCEPDNVEIHYNYLGVPCSMNIGVWNQVNNMVNAILNWWGEDDGPGSPNSGYTYDAITGRIADGNGDDVIGIVHFDPWWGVEACGIVDPTDVALGQPVHFDASCSFAYDENGPINPGYIEYMWKFGDGSYSYSKTCTHIYNTPGIYDVVLRIKTSIYYIQGENEILMDFAYYTVNVDSGTASLSANANPENLKNFEGIINHPIKIYGSAQGGQPPYNYKWNLGDGTTSNEKNPIHIYTYNKEYNIILTVTDAIGATAQDSIIITIYTEKLLANAGGPYIGNAGEEISFQGQAVGGLEPYYYIWDFCNGRNIIQKQDATYTFYKEGTYYVKLAVIDSKGNIDEDIVKVQIIKNQESHSYAEIKEVKGGLGIKATINAGEDNCPWEITVEGLVFFGAEKSGTIDAKTQETVKLGISIALGNVNIKIIAGTKQKQYTAFALGPFYLNVQEV